jgi:PAS domain S-box-containing protein
MISAQPLQQDIPVARRLPSELLLAGLTATADAVIGVSPAMRVMLYNPAAQELFGFHPDEVLGRPVEQLVPDSASQLAAPVNPAPAATAGATMAGSETRLIGTRKDGSRFEASARVVAVTNSDGPFLSVVLRPMREDTPAVAELSLLKAMALAIGASEDLHTALGLTLQQIGEFAGCVAGESWIPGSAGDALLRGPVWARSDSELQEFHRASEACRFQRGEGLPGQAWESGSPVWSNDVTEEPYFVRAALARDAGLGAAFAVPVLAGSTVVAVIVLYHSDQRPPDAGVVDLVATVAAQLGTLIQRKQAEDRLAQHTEELARSNAELEQFAYVASHDLQEPLRMVASYTRLLERRYRDKLDADACEFIEYAVEGVTRMQQLILDLLALSRVKTRGEAFELVELEPVLDHVLRDLGSSVDECQATISWDPLPCVYADAGQIAQVLQNLIANALKFRRDEAPRIHLSARREAGTWVFSCRDNGIGIAEDYYDRIFVIFQRLHTRDQYPGTGIGLSICKKIIERHGGRMWVASEPGRGSEFFFTLPADQRANGCTLR